MTTTAEFIAGFEGYAGRAYWDVTAWRLGYGSDTEGPDQVHVTEGMETTKARALQNLALRIPQFQTEAVYGKTGMTRPVWDKLTEHQKTAITSLVYNYGRLPIIVTPGDPEKTATAIKGLQNANGGVNRNRRISEAAFYLTADATEPLSVPIQKVPATLIPIPAAPPSAAPAGLPPISATTAGRRAAEQAYIAGMLGQLRPEYAALGEEIAAFEQMEAAIGKLNPAPTTQLSFSPVLPPPAAESTAAITIQGNQPMAVINWKTTISAVISAAGGIATQFPQFAPYAQVVSSLGTLALGFFAQDAVSSTTK